MHIACLGGGPAGLYFAIAMKRRAPRDEILVVERNRSYDTFGWGVVLSDETLANLAASDPESADAIRRAFVYWDDIAVFYRGGVTRSSGHGFCGIGRKRLLEILQDRARSLGVALQFEPSSTAPTAIVAMIWWSRPTARTRKFAPRWPTSSSRTSTCAPASTSGSARGSGFRTVHLHLRRNRARLDLGARVSVRRRDGHVHRRVLRRDVAAVRLRRDEPGGHDRRLRTHLRQAPRRPSSCGQRRAPARIGMAQFPSRAVRGVGRKTMAAEVLGEDAFAGGDRVLPAHRVEDRRPPPRRVGGLDDERGRLGVELIRVRQDTSRAQFPGR